MAKEWPQPSRWLTAALRGGAPGQAAPGRSGVVDAPHLVASLRWLSRNLRAVIHPFRVVRQNPWITGAQRPGWIGSQSEASGREPSMTG